MKENKLGSMPVHKLLVQMSLPIVFSMMVQALYNVVDSIFVAKYSNDALTAVSLIFPIQMLMIAVSTGTGVGVNSLLSRRLGEKNHEAANEIATTSYFLAILSYLAFALFGIFGSGFFIRSFTNNESIQLMGEQYIFICTVFSFGLFIQIASEKLMQAYGNTVYNMIIQCTGALINIILDPILIFGLFGLPSLGIKGAAIATVIGQITAMLLAFFLIHCKMHDIHINIKSFRPRLETIKAIYVVGLPAIIMNSITSVMTMGLNQILEPLSQIAVNVLGVYFKLQSFIFMPVFGLTSGMIPIISFNYGAKNRKRIDHTIKLSARYAIGIMAIGTVLLQCIPGELLSIFDGSTEMIQMGTPALRVISTSFIFAAISIIFSSVFQAVGNGVLSLVMSVIRQLAILWPVAFVLSRFLGVNGVWIAFPIAESICLVLALIFMKRVKRDYLVQL